MPQLIAVKLLQSPRMEKLASIVQQLQQERARIDAALRALTGVSNHRGARGTASRTGRRNLSAAARRRIAAAQRDRWAKWKASKARKA
jgi:hypothetical protein